MVVGKKGGIKKKKIDKTIEGNNEREKQGQLQKGKGKKKARDNNKKKWKQGENMKKKNDVKRK